MHGRLDLARNKKHGTATVAKVRPPGTCRATFKSVVIGSNFSSDTLFVIYTTKRRLSPCYTTSAVRVVQEMLQFSLS